MTATTSSTGIAAELQLLTEDIPWVRDRLRWVADLADGLAVFMDDGRTDARPAQAWARLGAYCRRAGTHIVRFRLQFGPNVVWLPENRPGYFFCKSAFGVYGEPRSHEGFVGGYLEDGKVYTRRYKTPELTPLDATVRDPDFGSPCLIARTCQA